MKTRTEVVEMVRAKVRLLHFSLSTEDTYGAWIGRYYDRCGRVASRETLLKRHRCLSSNLTMKP